MDKDVDPVGWKGDLDLSVEEQIKEAIIGTRRIAALTAAATAFPKMLQSVSEVDRGVLELARSFERYLEKG